MAFHGFLTLLILATKCTSLLALHPSVGTEVGTREEGHVSFIASSSETNRERFQPIFGAKERKDGGQSKEETIKINRTEVRSKRLDDYDFNMYDSKFYSLPGSSNIRGFQDTISPELQSNSSNFPQVSTSRSAFSSVPTINPYHEQENTTLDMVDGFDSFDDETFDLQKFPFATPRIAQFPIYSELEQKLSKVIRIPTKSPKAILIFSPASRPTKGVSSPDKFSTVGSSFEAELPMSTYKPEASDILMKSRNFVHGAQDSFRTFTDSVPQTKLGASSTKSLSPKFKIIKLNDLREIKIPAMIDRNFNEISDSFIEKKVKENRFFDNSQVTSNEIDNYEIFDPFQHQFLHEQHVNGLDIPKAHNSRIQIKSVPLEQGPFDSEAFHDLVEKDNESNVATDELSENKNGLGYVNNSPPSTFANHLPFTNAVSPSGKSLPKFPAESQEIPFYPHLPPPPPIRLPTRHPIQDPEVFLRINSSSVVEDSFHFTTPPWPRPLPLQQARVPPEYSGFILTTPQSFMKPLEMGPSDIWLRNVHPSSQREGIHPTESSVYFPPPPTYPLGWLSTTPLPLEATSPSENVKSVHPPPQVKETPSPVSQTEVPFRAISKSSDILRSLDPEEPLHNMANFSPPRPVFPPPPPFIFKSSLPQLEIDSFPALQDISTDSDEELPKKYEFRYVVTDPTKGIQYGHAESREGVYAKGEYFVTLPDGDTQHVTYRALENGYRAEVKYFKNRTLLK